MFENSYYDNEQGQEGPSELITQYLAQQHVSDNVINDVREIYAARREYNREMKMQTFPTRCLST